MPDEAAIFAAAFPPKKVLMLLTSSSAYPDESPTGYYLSEVVHPYNKFVAVGWEVGFASITGTATVDPSSVADGAACFDEEVQAFYASEESMALLATPTRIAGEEATPVEELVGAYDALYIAGGYGCVWDLPSSAEVQALVKGFYEAEGKVVAAVCHGPIVLPSIVLSDESKLLAGKACTGFTNAEEAVMGKTDVVAVCNGGPGSCEDAMDGAGAKFKDGGDFEANVVVDGSLMTGQNPHSAAPLAVAVIYFFDTIKAEFEPSREALLAERSVLVASIDNVKASFEGELATLKKEEAKGTDVAEKIESLQLKSAAARDYQTFKLTNIDAQLERNALGRQVKVDAALAAAATILAEAEGE